MAYTAVPDKATGSIVTETNWDTHIRDNINIGVMRAISETVVAGADATSVTIAAIVADFSHLMLVVNGSQDHATDAKNLLLQFNADGAGDYDWAAHAIDDAGTVVKTGAIAGTSIKIGSLPAFGAAAVGAVTAVIYDYGRATWRKAVSSHGIIKTSEASPGIALTQAAGVWRSTAAITSVTVLTEAGQKLKVGTVITLYGLPR